MSPCASDLGESRPETIKETGGEIKTIATLKLLRARDIGGCEWVRQFTFGFQIAGYLSQGGVYPPDAGVSQVPDMAGIWPQSAERFRHRAVRSGMEGLDVSMVRGDGPG